jgi:hypothetical protein
MIEPRMLAYLEANNEDALHDWARQHFELHQAIYNKVRLDGLKPFDAYAILIDMSDLEGWAYFHNLEHQNMSASIFTGGGPPDLTEIDPSDPISWESWHDAHSRIHEDLRNALKL